MPKQSDLVGAGLPPLQAAILGNEPSALTATGSAQTDAAPILSHLVTMTATGADGVILPSGALVGTPYYVYNSSGSTGLVYCPVGHTLNSTSNGSLSLATHKQAIFIQVSKGVWASNLTA
jgi:hypothetical protein